MGYLDIINKDLRLAILQVLEEDPDYTVNELVLSAALKATGRDASHDALRTQLGWLYEQGLIEIQEVDDLQIASITKRGEDVALGRVRVHGVARPGPRS